MFNLSILLSIDLDVGLGMGMGVKLGIVLCVDVQSFSKYLTQIFYFSCEIAHYGKSSTSVFQEIFIIADKIFISGEGLSTRQ